MNHFHTTSKSDSPAGMARGCSGACAEHQTTSVTRSAEAEDKNSSVPASESSPDVMGCVCNSTPPTNADQHPKPLRQGTKRALQLEPTDEPKDEPGDRTADHETPPKRHKRHKSAAAQAQPRPSLQAAQPQSQSQSHTGVLEKPLPGLASRFTLGPAALPEGMSHKAVVLRELDFITNQFDVSITPREVINPQGVVLIVSLHFHTLVPEVMLTVALPGIYPQDSTLRFKVELDPRVPAGNWTPEQLALHQAELAQQCCGTLVAPFLHLVVKQWQQVLRNSPLNPEVHQCVTTLSSALQVQPQRSVAGGRWYFPLTSAPGVLTCNPFALPSEPKADPKSDPKGKPKGQAEQPLVWWAGPDGVPEPAPGTGSPFPLALSRIISFSLQAWQKGVHGFDAVLLYTWTFPGQTAPCHYRLDLTTMLQYNLTRGSVRKVTCEAGAWPEVFCRPQSWARFWPRSWARAQPQALLDPPLMDEICAPSSQRVSRSPGVPQPPCLQLLDVKDPRFVQAALELPLGYRLERCYVVHNEVQRRRFQCALELDGFNAAFEVEIERALQTQNRRPSVQYVDSVDSLNPWTLCYHGATKAAARDICLNRPSVCLTGTNSGRAALGPGFYVSTQARLSLHRDYAKEEKGRQFLLKLAVLAHKPLVNVQAAHRVIPATFNAFADRAQNPLVLVLQDPSHILPLVLMEVSTP